MKKAEAPRVYEANLQLRLNELKKGDFAYYSHQRVIKDAICYSTDLHRDPQPQTILDCGCGLGFMTAALHKHWQTVGIDVSERSIEVARQEHPGVLFYAEPAAEFAAKMAERNILPFNHAILNMVVHSVDDATIRSILKGIRLCLKPEGTIILIVPSQEWLARKLFEYAIDMGKQKEEAMDWMRAQMKKRRVPLVTKINGGTYYPEPIPIYNRSEARYGTLLRECGFCVPWQSYNSETNELLDTTILPYLDGEMFTSSFHILSTYLDSRERQVLMSFAFDEEKFIDTTSSVPKNGG